MRGVYLVLETCFFCIFATPVGGGGKTSLSRPYDVVNKLCLQQQIAPGKKVVTDEVLVHAHSNTVPHTQGPQHIQHLAEKEKKKGTVVKQHDEEGKNATVSAETMICTCQVPWLVQMPLR